jgi:DNA polymerase-3 subunit delta'
VSQAGGRQEPDGIEGVALPEDTPAIIGHDTARANITASLTATRLPSAILLHGPQGIGKATLAFQIARQIFTSTGDEDAHRVSEQVAAGSHPNLFVLRRQPKDAKGFYTVIRVDDIRELRERLRKTRGRAGYRVAIIDAIDDCNPSAANALLKTLEEPPAETLFLLISHRPGQLLPTIKSRCHSLALRPLSDGDVRAVIDLHGVEAEPEALDRAIALAHGRPRRAFEALLMANGTALAALGNWLGSPLNFPAAAHLELADVLASAPASAEAAFARGMVTDWVSKEARDAAIAGPEARSRLASANELWDKANALFGEQESLNLDARQTLIAIFDAIRRHIHLKTPH